MFVEFVCCHIGQIHSYFGWRFFQDSWCYQLCHSSQEDETISGSRRTHWTSKSVLASVEQKILWLLSSLYTGFQLHRSRTVHYEDLLHGENEGIVHCFTSFPFVSEAGHLPPGDRALPLLPEPHNLVAVLGTSSCSMYCAERPCVATMLMGNMPTAPWADTSDQSRS